TRVATHQARQRGRVHRFDHPLRGAPGRGWAAGGGPAEPDHRVDGGAPGSRPGRSAHLGPRAEPAGRGSLEGRGRRRRPGRGTRMNRIRGGFALMAVVLLVGAACGKGTATTTGGGPSGPKAWSSS